LKVKSQKFNKKRTRSKRKFIEKDKFEQELFYFKNFEDKLPKNNPGPK